MNAQKKTFQRIFKFYEFFELKNIFSKQPYHFFIFFFFSLVVYMFIRSIIFQDYSNFMNDPTAGDDHNPQELALNPNYINRGQADPNSMENIPLSFHLSMRYLMFLMPFIFFLRIRRVVVYKKKDKNKENSPEEKKEKENYLSV